MEVIKGKTAGFCFGVKNAIEKAEKQTEEEKKIYCLGELVHNKQVIEKLESKGIEFIEDIKEAKNKVIIRSSDLEHYMHHGTTTNENVEQAFAEGMIMHHQMAVDMAQAILSTTVNEEIEDFAEDIIELQQEEITQMKKLAGL